MKRSHNIAAAGVIAGLALSPLAFAQGAPMVSATVERLDQAQGKITLQHGTIPNKWTL